MASRKSATPVSPEVGPTFIPLIMDIPLAAYHLCSTYGFIEMLFREKKVKSWIQGKRRVTATRLLEEYVEKKIVTA